VRRITMMKSDFNTLAVIESDGVVQLVLNRPGARNAISHEMMTELDQALDAAETDPDVTAVVLRGEGKLFSAGHDLKEQFAGKDFQARTFPHASPSVRPALPRAWYFRKPLIGALHNYVGPYAIAIVACCDFNIAAPGTRFSCEIFKGTYPDIEWLPLYLQLPMRVIEKLWLMGGWMDAEQALQFQLVQRVVPEDQVLDEALRWARQVSLVPSEAFGHGKDKIRRSIELLGLNSLPSVLDKNPRLSGGEERASFTGNVPAGGAKELVQSLGAGFDPDIARI
jgi:enoyl-CoA hydratase/carnithine racemase